MNASSRLLDVVRQVSRQRALSRKTENAYVNHIRRFQQFYAERDLTEIGANGINDFLEHLKQAENLAAATQNQALSALSFLYRDVFGHKTVAGLDAVKRPKSPEKDLVVFSALEARAVLAEMRGETLLVAALMYGSGLRLSEAVAVRLGDLDLQNREIVVRDADGRRERTTLLPEKLVRPLEKHLRRVRYLYEDDCLLGYGRTEVPAAIEKRFPAAPGQWRWQFVFPSHNLHGAHSACRHHLAESTVQKAVGEALLKAGIRKPACCQTFRYSFAARLFEKNYDLRDIQTLLGHKNLKSTAVYMQFATRRDG